MTGGVFRQPDVTTMMPKSGLTPVAIRGGTPQGGVVLLRCVRAAAGCLLVISTFGSPGWVLADQDQSEAEATKRAPPPKASELEAAKKKHAARQAQLRAPLGAPSAVSNRSRDGIGSGQRGGGGVSEEQQARRAKASREREHAEAVQASQKTLAMKRGLALDPKEMDAACGKLAWKQQREHGVTIARHAYDRKTQACVLSGTDGREYRFVVNSE